MNSAPHLRLEDRPEFERVLDEALRTMARNETGSAPRLGTADLRALAIADAPAIAAHAASEYSEYVRVRERLRQPAGTAAPASDAAAPDGPTGADGSPSLATSMTESSGAGVFAVLSVLMPVLSGTAAVIFLLVGYALGVVSPEPALAQPMRNVGWVFTAVTIAAVLIGAISLLLTASRNAPTARRGSTPGRGDASTDEVAVARAAWRHALLQRAILPFLRDAQLRAAEGGEEFRTPGPRLPEDDHRTPRLGYSGPDFSARAAESGSDSAVERNRFSSPRYGSSRFSSPKYSTDGPASGADEAAGGTGGTGSGGTGSGGTGSGRRFSSPKYQSGSTDSGSEGRRFSSPGFKSGSTDSPAEDEGGHRFSSPKFRTPGSTSDADGGSTDTTEEDGTEENGPRV